MEFTGATNILYPPSNTDGDYLDYYNLYDDGELVIGYEDVTTQPTIFRANDTFDESSTSTHKFWSTLGQGDNIKYLKENDAVILKNVVAKRSSDESIFFAGLKRENNEYNITSPFYAALPTGTVTVIEPSQRSIDGDGTANGDFLGYITPFGYCEGTDTGTCYIPFGSNWIELGFHGRLAPGNSYIGIDAVVDSASKLHNKAQDLARTMQFNTFWNDKGTSPTYLVAYQLPRGSHFEYQDCVGCTNEGEARSGQTNFYNLAMEKFFSQSVGSDMNATTNYTPSEHTISMNPNRVVDSSTYEFNYTDYPPDEQPVVFGFTYGYDGGDIWGWNAGEGNYLEVEGVDNRDFDVQVIFERIGLSVSGEVTQNSDYKYVATDFLGASTEGEPYIGVVGDSLNSTGNYNYMHMDNMDSFGFGSNVEIYIPRIYGATSTQSAFDSNVCIDSIETQTTQTKGTRTETESTSTPFRTHKSEYYYSNAQRFYDTHFIINAHSPSLTLSGYTCTSNETKCTTAIASTQTTIFPPIELNQNGYYPTGQQTLSTENLKLYVETGTTAFTNQTEATLASDHFSDSDDYKTISYQNGNSQQACAFLNHFYKVQVKSASVGDNLRYLYKLKASQSNLDIYYQYGDGWTECTYDDDNSCTNVHYATSAFNVYISPTSLSNTLALDAWYKPYPQVYLETPKKSFTTTTNVNFSVVDTSPNESSWTTDTTDFNVSPYDDDATSITVTFHEKLILLKHYVRSNIATLTTDEMVTIAAFIDGATEFPTLIGDSATTTINSIPFTLTRYDGYVEYTFSTITNNIYLYHDYTPFIIHINTSPNISTLLSDNGLLYDDLDDYLAINSTELPSNYLASQDVQAGPGDTINLEFQLKNGFDEKYYIYEIFEQAINASGNTVIEARDQEVSAKVKNYQIMNDSGDANHFISLPVDSDGDILLGLDTFKSLTIKFSTQNLGVVRQDLTTLANNLNEVDLEVATSAVYDSSIATTFFVSPNIVYDDTIDTSDNPKVGFRMFDTATLHLIPSLGESS